MSLTLPRIGRFARAVRAAPFASLLGLLASGCVVSIPGRSSDSDPTGQTATTQRHVILGFGLVEVRTDTPAATVKRTRALGLHFSNEPSAKLALGYAESSVIAVPPQAEDVRLEAREVDGIFTVKVDSAKLKPSEAVK